MITIILITKFLLEFSIMILLQICLLSVGYFTIEKLRIYYWRWKDRRSLQRWQKNHEMHLQQQCKRKLHRKEREKYPLFYWRELIEEKLEDGNF